MQHRYSLLPVLLLAALSLGVTVSHAAKPTRVVTPLLGTPRKADVSTPQRVNAICQLGVTGAPASIVDGYILPPDDQYYTLMDPAACGCNGEGGVLLSNAHVLLSMPVAGCTIPMSVAVVQADLSNPNCPVPMPGHYIGQPAVFNLSVAEAGSYDFTFPLDAGVCITEKAFLLVTFLTNGDCGEGNVPGLITTDTCDPCVSWNVYPGNFDDLCDNGFPGNPVMSVEAACCTSVPAGRGTWGRLKTLYR
jgi:hypothetical protein